MNCGQCGMLLYATQAKCRCGWRVPPQRSAPSPARENEDPNDSGAATRRKCAERQSQVNKLVSARAATVSRRDACIDILKRKGLYSALPASIRATVEDDEARKEREAIQQEGASQ